MNRHEDSRENPRPEVDDAALSTMLRDSLRASERHLDPATQARLRSARKAAVAIAAKPGLRWPWTFAVPALGAAAFAGWVMLSPLRPHREPVLAPTAQAPTVSAQIEVLELLGSDDAPVSDEDVEFVNWLDDARDDG